jgi:hypothetical protein
MRTLISRMVWVAVAAVAIGLTVVVCQAIQEPALHPDAACRRVVGHESGPTVQDVIDAMGHKGFPSPPGAAEPPE